MWDQTILEIFATNIPQGFAFVLLYFSLTNIKIRPKLYIITSCIYAIAAYIIRPYVNFGVHTIILLLLLVLISVKWGKVNLLTAVIYGVVPFIVGYVTEWITFIFLGLIQFNVAKLSTDAILRAWIGLIPISMTFVVSLSVYFIKKHVNEIKGDKNVVV